MWTTTIDRLEEEILRTARYVADAAHPDCQAERAALRRATVPQRDVMKRLSRGEFPQFIRPETAMYYRDMFDHLMRIEYLIESRARSRRRGAEHVPLGQSRIA